MSILRVLIADDHKLFSDGIRRLLSAQPGWEVVGEAVDGNDAIGQAKQLRPDVVLIDISMPGLSSFQAAREIRKDRTETRILFVSMYDDEEYLRQAMESGASGYVLKDSPGPELITAIREVAKGGTYLSPRMLSKFVDNFRSSTKRVDNSSRPGSLTNRELQVLKLLAEGQSVKEIAGSLNLSVKTVEAHKFNLMRKLDIHNKAHLVQYAIQKKIIRIHDNVQNELV